VCGIFACAGSQQAVNNVLQGLKDLEYRGYDSAGIAALSETGIAVVRREGKIANLERALAETHLAGLTAMGHTRWATHGRPSDANSHPHCSCDGAIAVVHNGIVENYAQLRTELVGRGHAFASETDTEVIAHLLEEAADDLNLVQALRRAAARLEGSQAIAAMSIREPGVVACARIGNAGGVVIGHGSGVNYLASDLAALLPHTRRVTFLADHEFARVSASNVEVVDRDGRPIPISIQDIALDAEKALKGPYDTYMLKEIMEQPEALADTIQSLVSVDPPGLLLSGLEHIASGLADVRRVVLIGMGTSLHAAMLGRQYIERIAGVPAESDNASEFRYRQPVLDEYTLVVSVSQSGETVDVLEAMKVARDSGALQVTICNTPGSQTTRVADGTVFTRAGLERGVASTKCLLTATAALYILALGMAQARGRLEAAALQRHIHDLAQLPELVGRALLLRPEIASAAKNLDGIDGMLFLGRGLGFPVAMEGALKMKEISYIHAEGYAAGEMKHGPIALIDERFPTVAIATKHALRSKMISNIQQVQSRKGPLVAVTTEGDEELAAMAGGSLAIPDAGPWLEPIVATVPLQLLAYEVAVSRGCDVDQPRNLAKTVTVE
jgi:glucosamine--fructose-6-phosphate aminotransferase (isomerizing)